MINPLTDETGRECNHCVFWDRISHLWTQIQRLQNQLQAVHHQLNIHKHLQETNLYTKPLNKRINPSLKIHFFRLQPEIKTFINIPALCTKSFNNERMNKNTIVQTWKCQQCTDLILHRVYFMFTLTVCSDMSQNCSSLVKFRGEWQWSSLFKSMQR